MVSRAILHTFFTCFLFFNSGEVAIKIKFEHISPFYLFVLSITRPQTVLETNLILAEDFYSVQCVRITCLYINILITLTLFISVMLL